MLIVVDEAVDLPGDGVRIANARSTSAARGVPRVPAPAPEVRRVAAKVWDRGSPFLGDGEELWTLLRAGRYPSTGPPTVDELVAAYQADDAVVGIHVSAQLSATLAHAAEAAARVGPAVTVVDTRSLSVGAGLVADTTRGAVIDGASDADAIALARSLPERIHTFALVEHVAVLRHSDRASLVPGAHLAQDHPLVLAIRGRVVPLTQVRHRRKAVDELVHHLRATGGDHLDAWALGHGDAADVGEIVDRIADALGVAPRFTRVLGPTVGAHLGPDALVVGALGTRRAART